ncbi:M15 family metallopeptidase [Paraburkholderia dinghuensis]|uniref:M15 family peptidase n=1 Tax=Paraburkholderia dinghuensis TaxID=2305225 RepID=A0A3N6MX98_9BURK|nr:M15 family metallopeptidase [Paraburkholderia dinghuensis]RQH06615.1 M15 family peptidase [Paraburkholderia dinghuensis]
MATLTLGQKQRKFTLMVAKLIEWIYANGYEASFAEAYRPPETAALYAKQGKGVANSLHTSRLAVDLNLFKDGVYLTKSEQYRGPGEYWESLGGSWGGRFRSPDGNHFSLEHNGVR